MANVKWTTVRWSWILPILWLISLIYAQKNIEDGGYITENMVIRKHQSPLFIRNDIIITEKATISVDPGVTMQFAPGVMMAVNGTLVAKGTPEQRIIFTKGGSSGDDVPQWPSDIRLVDERTVMEGRLQLLYNGKWRGVCANFQNWTEYDVTVACRQLGFERGNFTGFLSWARNESAYILYHKPLCVGSEQKITQCPGSSKIEIGSRICEHQGTIHLRCEGLAAGVADNHWWGLEFYNTSIRNVVEGNIDINETSSILEYVDILYAGADKERNPVPAVRASPFAPFLMNVRIMYSALDGTNFTDLKASTKVHNSIVKYNRGHGLVAESHFGRISITDSTFEHNYGNGIKTKLLDGHWNLFDPKKSFCERTNLLYQTFPQIIIGVPGLSPPCSQLFRSRPGEILTFNILEMMKEPDAVGEIDIYDGDRSGSPKITTLKITNGTLPQGVTSSRNYMYVQFRWTKPWECPHLPSCIKFTMMIDSGPEVVPEFRVNNTNVLNNTIHGVYLENVRNYATINASVINNNAYGAGLRVYGGAGDVVVNATTINHNRDNGVNITYAGGYRIFNMSSFSYNQGNGINITFNETTIDNKTRISRHQKTEVSRSDFSLNTGMGIRVGNFCQTAKVVVNDSRFITNGREAIEFESCFKTIHAKNFTNFTVGYNTFTGNYGHAVKISPLLNSVGRIANNTISAQSRYSILIDNGDDFMRSRMFYQLPVNYEIWGNNFFNNRGFYVLKARLTEGSRQQKMIVKYNRFTDNVIEGAFPKLNERTKAFAVVIISSSNINLTRNHIENRLSKFEVATHLLDRSALIDARTNWWGTVDYVKIVTKIFDQLSRYDLALVKYHPALQYNDLTGPVVTDRSREEEIPFDRGTTLGGRLGVYFRNRFKNIHVDRDITILPTGTLDLLPGTVLEFENSVGMLVEGELKANGDPNSEIVMTSQNVSTTSNSSRVRLVDGEDDFEGRVEVRPTDSDVWGTVCEKAWTIIDASVVCQMLGMVVHPNDWKPVKRTPGSFDQPIWRSNVGCTVMDMDITKCKADGLYDHSCKHNMDVHVRCKKPTWAGIRFMATSRPSVLRHATLSLAGLMDPTAILYSPAIKIDYNVHTMNNLKVTQCMSSGIEIMKNDAYATAQVSYSDISDNLGTGIMTHGSFFMVTFSDIRGNSLAGIEYNPHYTVREAEQIRAGINDPLVITPALTEYNIPDRGYKFMVTKRNSVPEYKTYEIEVKVSWFHRVIIDLLDYNPDTTQENLTIYDSPRNAIGPDTRGWTVEQDLVDFPIQSTQTVLTIRWKLTGASSGRLSMVLRSKHYQRRWPIPYLEVRNSTVYSNQKGIRTRHYNQPSNEFLDLFFRNRWENLIMYGVTFDSNKEEALHVPSITKYHELYMPTHEELQTPLRIAEIVYAVDSCYFTQNGGGIKGEHNHVEFSNNAWIWQITNNRFIRNKGGGIALELPKVTYMEYRFNHSIDVNDTLFDSNQDFQLIVEGFYCNSSIARNLFVRNACNKGCITFSGTEKDTDMHENRMYENVGKYMVEFFMTSHAPYSQWVDANVYNNDFKRNRKPLETSKIASSSPTSYTFGVKGLQNVTINRNLFSNSLDFEMVAGQTSSSLENYLDVTENFWGTRDQFQIMDRLFDFDDWNSYSIAEYYPYLVNDNFGSPLSTGGKVKPDLDISKPLGGRVETYLLLKKRLQPYIVKSDLTIMPKASLVIEPGCELQFYPNIGILVLGSLTVRGYSYDRVKFNPILRSTISTKSDKRNKRSMPTVPADKIRLRGGGNADEGFLEMYNATERRWALFCDPSFNDKTAEVACRNMGKESSNAIIRRSRLYDHYVLGYPKMHEQKIEWFWRNTFICDGTEADLSKCRYKNNFFLHRCMEQRNYLFVKCGQRNLDASFDYWGGIRFSTPEYEQGKISPGFSDMQFVDIYGAGILHGEKTAAVQAVYRTPTTEYVRITNCAWNGYDYIAPKADFEVKHNDIENNNGYAVGGLVLNGDSRYDVPPSSFIPLYDSSVPYNVFGLVRMCSQEKLLWFQDRVLLYYKYRFDTVDCIKILRSKEQGKRIGVRFLQINMYDDPFYKNAVQMYNGDVFEDEFLIGEVTSNSSSYERSIKYETSSEYYDFMGIRITASAAHGDYGFIAEVVTLPLSPSRHTNLGPGHRQKILNTAMTGNQGGGLRFMNVGELNPSVIVENCRIQAGGQKILNLTSPAVMYLNIQNSRLLTIANNYIGHNGGGVFITANTHSIATALYANITNNVINFNTHSEALHVDGHHYQGVSILSNYIAHNDGEYRNTISLFGVHLNFTSNIVYNNTGYSNLNVTLPEKVSISQKYLYNFLHDNYAIGRYKTTIYCGTAKHLFNRNFLVNRWNIFELVTYNRTKYPDQRYPHLVATSNWWGQPYKPFVSGRIWDRWDDDNLMQVNFVPFLTSNYTLLQGRCHPGWRLYKNKCYLYMGGVLPYAEASKQCLFDRGKLAWARDRNYEHFFGEMISSSQSSYDEFRRTWIYSEWRQAGYCTSLRNYKIEQQDCSLLLPYICEKDPYIVPTMDWFPIIVSVSVVGSVLIIVFILIVFAFLKAKTRTKQRLERRNSLRASVRSSKQSVYSNQQAIQIDRVDEYKQKRRRPPLRSDNGIIDISGVTLDSSTDTIDKIKHRPGTPNSTLDYSSSKLESSSYYDSDLNYYPPRLENEITNISAKPMFDTVLRNEIAYDERSLDRSMTESPRIRVLPRSYGRTGSTDSDLDQRTLEKPKPKETAM